MNSNLLDQITDTLQNPNGMNSQDLQQLLSSIFMTINGLKTRLGSTDERERQGAIQERDALKTQLEDRFTTLCESAGIDSSLLDGYTKSPENFSPAMRHMVQQTTNDLDRFKHTLLQNS